uniref:Uncharacterized protein n=1 Tax=Candidatus Methanogaster sp. ANME-2c ERB4 TaxID=2759911 RepID=A0A7G9Y5Q1_9EURY|nr:hypothetical protein BADFEEBK_00005 [Methanosarcinales archaeon ANME-2c ERB4]
MHEIVRTGLPQHAVLQSIRRAHQTGDIRDLRILEHGIPEMCVRIHKSRQDDAVRQRIHTPRLLADISDHAIPDADVALDRIKVLTAEDASREQVFIYRHIH